MSKFADQVLQKSVEKLYGAGTTVDDLSADELKKAAADAKKVLKKEQDRGIIDGTAAADIDAKVEMQLNPRGEVQQARAAEAKSRDISSEVTDLARDNMGQNRQFVDANVVPLLQNQKNAAGAAQFLDQQALAGQQQSRDQTKATLTSILQQQDRNATDRNYKGDQLTNEYARGNAALNAQDQQALSEYNRQTDPLMARRNAGGYGADVAFDPYGYASQQSALELAQGAADGSLDYQAAQYGRSKAGDAFADAGDVQAQRRSLSDIQGDIRDGGSDQRAALGRIVSELDNGGKDQRDVMEKYKSLTTPTATAAERYMSEIARRGQESQMKSSRDAVLDSQAARGLRSGGAEIASMQQAAQQTAQDRTLAELGINAQAVGRSMDALKGYAGAADSLRAGQQQGLGLYSSGSNALRASQQNALGMQGDLSTALRNASFDEAFKRGSAQDEVGMFDVGQKNTASANNQGTRMAGINQTGTMANQIRSSNDAINTFNKEQSQISQRFQDSYAQQEAERVGGLANQRIGNALGTTAQAGTRNTQTYDAGVSNNDTGYNRSRDTTNDATSAAKDIYGMDTDVNAMQGDVGERNFNRQTGVLNSANSIAGTRAGNSQDLDTLINALRAQKGDIEAARAEKAY